ncbi:sigma-70 family RNA polymerase sigma factor [Paenibacillus glycanilyticus]|uniref:sigma-70 family RNA polymerase sigma factor n=1 Tax=Paenibacillus glycanilyticus TaxID=126569 RepID=UPI00203CCD45|nr:sigma-70 family RNA polymerase sigma factor [Paenibacillus glycanilyticus]MCM3628535.1 sigma-70 family RNA polymerase sigma factor [Paenibacillus glycanilyticus]
MLTANDTALDIEQLYREYKPLLTSIAYRMLGSMSEAEDAVQDVFVTVSKLEGIDISYPKAYLVKLLTNRVLNVMKSAPRKRESYPGQWLPEPVMDGLPEASPLDNVIQHEQLGYALLVLLQTCTPPERAVFVLRESFGYEYAEIAAMLDKSEAACRKIFSRASAKIGHSSAQDTDSKAMLDESMTRFVQSFSEAIYTGRLESFIHLLTDDAVLITDGGGIVRSAFNPIIGPHRVIAFLEGIARKGALAGDWRTVSISGQKGLMQVVQDKAVTVYLFEPDEQTGKIRSMYSVTNPEKLTRIQ